MQKEGIYMKNRVNTFATDLKELLNRIDKKIEKMEKYGILDEKYTKLLSIKYGLLKVIEDLLYDSGSRISNVEYDDLDYFQSMIFDAICYVNDPDYYIYNLEKTFQEYRNKYVDLKTDINNQIIQKEKTSLFIKVGVGTFCVLGSITISAIIFSSNFAKRTFKAEKDNKYSNSIVTTATTSKRVSTVSTTTSKQTFNKIDNLNDNEVTTVVTTTSPTTTITITPKTTETESTITTTAVPETSAPETSLEPETTSITETSIITETEIPVSKTEEYTITESETEESDFFVAPDGSVWESEADYLEWIKFNDIENVNNESVQYVLHF
jgi:hypothetical protein